VILNNRGIPVANVVIPGRDKGKHLTTSNLAFKPGTDEAYITAGERGGLDLQVPGIGTRLDIILTPVTVPNTPDWASRCA